MKRPLRDTTFLVSGGLAGLTPTLACAQAGAMTPGVQFGVTALAFIAAAFFGAWGMAQRFAARRGDEDAALDAAQLSQALLLGGEDGALIVRGGRLIEALGGAVAAAPFVGRRVADQAEAIAARLAGPQDRAAFVRALNALARDGAAADFAFGDAEGRRRSATTRAVGGLGVLRLSAIARAKTGEGAAMREALASTPALAWARGADGRIEWANAAYLAAAGVRNVAQLNRQGVDLFRPDPDGAEPGVARRPVVIDGARRVFAAQETGGEAGAVGVAVDVTAVSDREDALRRDASSRQQTLEQLRLGVAIFDRDLRLTFFNDAVARLWEQDADWLRGEPQMREILDAMRERRRLPEEGDYAQWRARLIGVARDLSGPEEFEWHLPDGGTLHVIARPHAQGGVLFVFEDVSQVFALRRRFKTATAVQQAALMQLTEGVAVFGGDGALRFFNPAFAAIWGLRADELPEIHVQTLSTRCAGLYNDEAFWARLVAQVTGAGAARRSWAATLHREDESVLEVNATPLPDGAMMFSFFDATDSYLKEKTLRERNEALESASRLKTDFLNGIHSLSFEINTPLNTIVGFSDILGQEMYGPLNARQHEYIDGINIASNELRAFIGDIVDLAKLEADGMRFNIEQVDVYRTLSTVRRYVEASAKENGLSLRFSCPKNIGEIPADAPRLKQIGYNIATSVIRSTFGPGVVELGARREGDHVDITLTLIGREFPDALRSVFDQSEAHEGLAGGGRDDLRAATLGLTVVRRVVERHGGRVFLEDRPDERGATIVCRMSTDIAAVHIAVEASE